MRVAPQILLSDEDRADLQALVAAGATNPRLALRARIILLAAEGIQNKAIAAHLGVGRVQVARWRDRYAQARLAGIEHDLPRGAPPVRVDVGRLVELASEPATAQLSTRSLAAELGVSASSVSRHWRSTGLPSRHMYPVLPSPDFDGQPVDIVGLYVAPREHALALACGMAGGEAPSARPGTAVQRHLATSFMTALQLVDADASALPTAMHGPDTARPADWLGFLHALEAGTPDGITLHLIADNHVAQQHPDVREWLARHPRLAVHRVAGVAAWRRTVQQLLRGAPCGLAASISEVLAFMSEPVCWPLRWLRHGDAGQPRSLLSPGSLTQAAPWPQNAARPELGSAFLPRRHAIPSAGVMAGPQSGREAVEPVDSAKLLPPRQGGQAIPREALMARLQEARRRRCVVMQGQAAAARRPRWQPGARP